MEYHLSGLLIRGTQIVVDASIWIMFGCFIAAFFRNMLGAKKTRALFGNSGRYGLLIGWAVGMLLPVCSLGVIPVVRELHRAKVNPGTIVAFGLTAPLFNPLSVLYGLSLPNPFAILIFSAAAMVIVTIMGALWGRLFKNTDNKDNDENKAEEQQAQSTGVRRSLSVFHGAATELAGWSFVLIAIGILASANFAALVPHGVMQAETEPDKPFAPLVMAAFVTPVYSTPLLAMSQIGSMFQHGNSIGAAFSLLILGAGINVGVIIWFASAFGLKRVFCFVGAIFALTVAIAYAIDKPLYPKGVKPSGHTHAFDIYTHPYGHGAANIMARSIAKAKDYREKNDFGATNLLAGLLIIGLVFRLVGTAWDFEKWLQTTTPTSNGIDIALPPWLIGTVACICLIGASITGTFVYYPHKTQVLDDLRIINTKCVGAALEKDWEGVKKWVQYCDDLSRRLEVGTFLREGGVSEFRRLKCTIYREKLDTLRDNIEVGQTANAKDQAMDVLRAYNQMSATFRETNSPAHQAENGGSQPAPSQNGPDSEN